MIKKKQKRASAACVAQIKRAEGGQKVFFRVEQMSSLWELVMSNIAFSKFDIIDIFQASIAMSVFILISVKIVFGL